MVVYFALGSEYVVYFLLSFGAKSIMPYLRVPQEVICDPGHALHSDVGRGAHLISFTKDYYFHDEETPLGRIREGLLLGWAGRNYPAWVWR